MTHIPLTVYDLIQAWDTALLERNEPLPIPLWLDEDDAMTTLHDSPLWRQVVEHAAFTETPDTWTDWHKFWTDIADFIKSDNEITRIESLSLDDACRILTAMKIDYSCRILAVVAYYCAGTSSTPPTS